MSVFMRNTVFGLLAHVFLIPAQVEAGEHAALFNEVTQAISDEFERNWAYTETSTESGSSTVARFNPGLPKGKRWHLLSVEGRSPTDTEIAEFVETRAEEESGDSERGTGIGNRVVPDGLKLIEETNDYWLFSFSPAEDDDDDAFLKELDATMKISKDGPFLEYVNIQNNKPFRPEFGVKISEFVTRLSFGPASDNGPIVPMSIETRIKERAFLAIRIDETVSVTFSDYEYVADRRKSADE